MSWFRIGALLVHDDRVVVVHLVFLAAQAAGHAGGLLEGAGGIDHGLHGALADLVEVAHSLDGIVADAGGGADLEEGGIDVELDGAGAESERIERALALSAVVWKLVSAAASSLSSGTVVRSIFSTPVW